MNLHKTYPSLLTADLAAAEGWYKKLLGRGPDHRRMATLPHWELSDEGGLMPSSSEEIDLAGERRRLDRLGIALGDDNEGDYSTLAQVRDPDGNLITFASPPKRPFPPA
jgi:catechol 2,3-dioxygenase-like lactoylglutathione lyase family enzyme